MYLRACRSLLLASLATLVLAAPGLAKTIGLATGNGYPIATATGFARHPDKLILSLEFSPAGRAKVFTNITCQSESLRFKRSTDDFIVTAPGRKRLAMPIKNPRTCAVEASVGYADAAQAAPGGTITARLIRKG